MSQTPSVQCAPPDGAWFSVVGNVRLGAGGQTRMVLLRQRLFLTQWRIPFPILTFNPAPTYAPIREGLLADGLLLPESELLNLHEDLRSRRLSGGEARQPIESEAVLDDVDAGHVWRRRHLDSSGAEIAWEYLRPDGSAYARTPADTMHGVTEVYDVDGHVVMSGNGLGALWRWWTLLTVGSDRDVYLVSDSRFIAEELGLLDDPRIVLMHQMHNPHLRGERRWNSPIEPSYAASLDHLDRFDALTTLTERQRIDLSRRFGDLEQFGVIANPVETVDRPIPAPRRVPGRIAVIARLHPQKQLDHAVRAFALVARHDANARLVIYGDGPEASSLRALAAELGVADRIEFKGHDPHAADELWTADLAWLTSRFEGYGLFILEARMRECPVVAYDVPYGPAEQIESGVDGVLVLAGDPRALAESTLELLTDRTLLESMRDRARAGAMAHGHAEFLTAWAKTARAARQRKNTRVRLDDVEVRVKGHEATVVVSGEGDLDDVSLQWQWWSDNSEEPQDVTGDVSRSDREFTIIGDLASIPRGAHQRLLLTWHNTTWQQNLTPRPVTHFWNRIHARFASRRGD